MIQAHQDFIFTYQFKHWWNTYSFWIAHSPITFSNLSPHNLVSLFRCPSPTLNLVYVRSVDPSILVYISSQLSLSFHRHPYIWILYNSDRDHLVLYRDFFDENNWIKSETCIWDIGNTRMSVLLMITVRSTWQTWGFRFSPGMKDRDERSRGKHSRRFRHNQTNSTLQNSETNKENNFITSE